VITPILSVSDIDAGIDYYTYKLGVSLNWRLANDDNAATFAGITLGESEILLGTIEFVPPADRDKLGAGIQLHVHGAPEVDIDQLFKRASDRGAKIVKEIKNREWGERAFVVHDRDGYNLTIAQQRL
jgi:uncharacterized glyoxalase superfamily protein PhnB